MAQNKMLENDASVEAFLLAVPDEKKRNDGFTLVKLFAETTGLAPKMWGESIIGFGSYHYKYASGREGDAPLLAFSPRKDNLVLYLSPEFEGREDLLRILGKHKTSKACLYIKKLQDIDMEALQEMIKASFAHTRSLYPVAEK